jgi:SAM-dependent methyltransferase
MADRPVLAEQRARGVARSYDAVADEYARRIAGELAYKPFDRELLDRFAERVAGRGRVCDVGCGPGHVTRYLSDRGVDILGLDLSPRMVELAAKSNPQIDFVVGNVLALAVPGATWSGAVAFYSLIHLSPAEIPIALGEISRGLRPDAPLLVAFHTGDETRHIDEWWERPVSLDTYFFRPDWFSDQLKQAGFLVEHVVVRPPYSGYEVETERAYVEARRGPKPDRLDAASSSASGRPGRAATGSAAR